MKDKEILNKIYENVYNKSVSQKEKFVEKFDRSDDRLKEDLEDDENYNYWDDPDDTDYGLGGPDDNIKSHAFSKEELSEITMDYLTMTLKEGVSKDEAIQTLAKGWNSYPAGIINLILDHAQNIYAENYSDD